MAKRVRQDDAIVIQPGRQTEWYWSKEFGGGALPNYVSGTSHFSSPPYKNMKKGGPLFRRLRAGIVTEDKRKNALILERDKYVEPTNIEVRQKIEIKGSRGVTVIGGTYEICRGASNGRGIRKRPRWGTTGKNRCLRPRPNVTPCRDGVIANGTKRMAVLQGGTGTASGEVAVGYTKRRAVQYPRNAGKVNPSADGAGDDGSAKKQ